MLQLKIDIVGNDLLTKTFYSKSKYQSLGVARKAATNYRNILFQRRTDGALKDYIVDIIPCNN